MSEQTTVRPYRWGRLTHPDTPQPRYILHLQRDKNAQFFSHAADLDEACALANLAGEQFAHLGNVVVIDRDDVQTVDLTDGTRRAWSHPAL
jgi:hypothetical protein